MNKEQIRGAKIDIASGAGLTSIMRLSECILALTKKNTLSLEYLKANDLERNKPRVIPLRWTSNSLIVNDTKNVQISNKKHIEK